MRRFLALAASPAGVAALAICLSVCAARFLGTGEQLTDVATGSDTSAFFSTTLAGAELVAVLASGETFLAEVAGKWLIKLRGDWTLVGLSMGVEGVRLDGSGTTAGEGALVIVVPGFSHLVVFATIIAGCFCVCFNATNVEATLWW